MEKMLVLILAALVVTSISAQANNATITTPFSNFTSWLPIIVLAVMLSVGIVALYYMFGVLLNNGKMRSAAMSEFSNALSTIVIVVIILAIFNLIGNATYATAAIPQNTTQSICNTLNGANINFISNNSIYDSPTYQICSSIIDQAGSSNITPNLDYPLASTYVIIANLTNQSITNLNAIYVLNSMMTFLGTFKATDSICVPNTTCLATPSVGLQAILGFTPFAGYTSIVFIMRPFLAQSSLIFTVFMMQLIYIIAMLFLWPYLLAAGIILRSTFLTRRVGGLLIAICITGMLVYPLIFLAQYAGLNSSSLSPIGVNATTTTTSSNGTVSTVNSFPILTLNGTTANDTNVTYNSNSINFYVFPRADYVLRSIGCWPHGGLLGQELIVIGTYATPGLGLAAGLGNLAGSRTNSVSTTVAIPFFRCNTAAATDSLFALANIYGLMSIIGVFFPLLDLLIGIAATIGISSLLGGTTSLFGLEKLI